ncbi:MAG: hypothetical protein PW735_01035 [Acidobacteriaceae bacterium]|nr:hypothetical protein [Acidobacteriaceae bacterium]
MPDTIAPQSEQRLSPDDVALLDRRRRRGQLLLVLGFQFGLMALFVSLWSGQDLTYSPGWVRPMFYWDALLALASVLCLGWGLQLRRGLNEFFSY